MDSKAQPNVCSVCNEKASLKCGGCKYMFYCSKEHQRTDWRRHKASCQAWEVRDTVHLGKHLIARRDLEPDDIIITESPLVWGPALHSSNRVCVGCGQICNPTEDVRCLECLWPACRVDCAGLKDTNRHAVECSLFTKSCRIIPRCDVLLVIRMYILWRTKSKRWTSLSKLNSHEESRGPGTEAYEEVSEICQHLSPLMNDDVDNKDIFPKICGLIDVNALETNPPVGSAAIYETACLLEHDCMANTRHNFTIDEKGRPRITVRAVHHIKKGEHLSTMYTHALWATAARRRHLLSTKYFSCHCCRCSDPTELYTFLGTMKCLCRRGLISPNDPLDFETEWSCNVCTNVLSTTEVSDLMDRLEEEVDKAMKVSKREVFADLLSRLTELLHPCHQYCISIGHSLIQLLPPDQAKRELCERILRVVTILDPYGTRLALYTAITLRELATCEKVRKKDLLLRALALLRYEPPNSSGEKLSKLIEMELSNL